MREPYDKGTLRLLNTFEEVDRLLPESLSLSLYGFKDAADSYSYRDVITSTLSIVITFSC